MTVFRNPIRVLIEAVPFSKDGQGRKLAPTETSTRFPKQSRSKIDSDLDFGFVIFESESDAAPGFEEPGKKLSAKFLGAAVG